MLLGIGVAAIAIVGAFAGLAAAGLTGSRQPQEAARSPATPPFVTTSRIAPVTSEAQPASTDGTSTSVAPTEPPPSSTVESTASTEATAKTGTSTSSTRQPSPTTVRSPQTSTTRRTTAPPFINVAYSQDSSGTLLIPRWGTAMIQLTNTGGEAGEWIMNLSGAGYRVDYTSGELDPGASFTVTVTDLLGKPHMASITALLSPGDRFVVPLRTN